MELAKDRSGAETKRPERRHDPVVSTDLAGLDVPGVIVEVDPDDAESMGAFLEEALTEAEAWESNDELERLLRGRRDGRA